MARKRKGDRTGALVDGTIASLDVGGPPISKKRCITSTVPAPVPSGPNSNPHDDTAPIDTTPVSSAKSWGHYFSEVGLLKLGMRRFKPWNSSARKSLRQNFARLNPIEYIAPFDLKKEMRASKRTQPHETNLSGFEDKNEPTLTLIEDDSCIIRDNSETAEPLVVKVGAMPMIGGGFSPAVSEALSAGLLFSTLAYTSSCNGGSIVGDSVRHSSKERRGGPIPRPANHSGSCHHIHAQHCARNDNEISNIRLFRGPSTTWDSRTTDESLNTYLNDLLPLTQLVEIIFKSVLPSCSQLYEAVKRKMSSGLGGVGSLFGLWRSRAIVVDSMTNVHRDLSDVCYGWCAIVPLGDFKGGDACLPGLGYRISLPVGSILFLRSHIIPHYIGYWTGHRFSIIHFSHQTTFDYYSQESNGKRLHDYNDMPGWWGSSRQNTSDGTVGLSSSTPPELAGRV